jgi:regulator of protease activity HflC (stomatin/prohibitin superfamily)
MLFAAIMFLILALIALVIGRVMKRNSRRSTATAKSNDIATWAAGGLAVVSVGFFAFASFYTQDAGTAVVEKDITGNIVGQSNSTGLHGKAPWVETVEFSIRNQQVVFAGTGNDGDSNGGVANGAQITVQDADGVSSNIDIALRYSIAPDSVTDIYREFLSEENFKKSFIEQDVRSVVRLVPNQFSTLDLLTKRGEVEAAVLAALEDRWSDDGVLVDSISLQEIRVPDAVKESYAAARQAQINVTKETANLEAAQVSAQQKVVQAQAEADANAILNGSLTENILSQRYLDTLSELAAAGNLVVVPEGFNGLVNVTK